MKRVYMHDSIKDVVWYKQIEDALVDWYSKTELFEPYLISHIKEEIISEKS